MTHSPESNLQVSSQSVTAALAPTGLAGLLDRLPGGSEGGDGASLLGGCFKGPPDATALLFPAGFTVAVLLLVVLLAGAVVGAVTRTVMLPAKKGERCFWVTSPMLAP